MFFVFDTQGERGSELDESILLQLEIQAEQSKRSSTSPVSKFPPPTSNNDIPTMSLLLRAVLPKVPTLLTGTASHLLSRNPHSQQWDFRTFVTIALLQSFMASPETRDRKGRVMTAEQIQAFLNTDREIDDKTWVARVSMPVEGVVSEEEVVGLEEMVDRAVREWGVGMGGGGGEVRVDMANVKREGLSGEWAGWRDVKKRGAYGKAKKGGKEWSEKAKFEALKEDIEGCREKEAEEGVVLWLHGGEYLLSYRWACWRW